jgi:sorting nexin-29
MLDNYRGISLINSAAKVLEMVLKNRLVPLAEEWLSDLQAGFRPARGCNDLHFILQEAVSSRREQELPSFVVFIDVKKAYDCTWREGLWALLSNAGVTGRMLTVLKALSK